MSRTKSYTNAPAHIAKEIEETVSIEDFLPSPQEIVEMLSKEETVPVTMKLKKKTVERYKKFAQEKGVKYQTFVSSVLDSYAKRL